MNVSSIDILILILFLPNLPYPPFLPLQRYLVTAALTPNIDHVHSLQTNAVESFHPDKYIKKAWFSNEHIVTSPSTAFPSTEFNTHMLYM